jgi:hypothetical protein
MQVVIFVQLHIRHWGHRITKTKYYKLLQALVVELQKALL